MLNKKQVQDLFEEEAVLFGCCDGVPINRVLTLFGKEAMKYATCRGKAGKWSNEWYVGNYSVGYLTKEGFYQAASYANVLEIVEKVKIEKALKGGQ